MEEREYIRSIYKYAREMWSGLSEQRGIRKGFVPVIKPDDYWNFAKRVLEKRVGKKKRLLNVIDRVRETLDHILQGEEVKGLILSSDAQEAILTRLFERIPDHRLIDLVERLQRTRDTDILTPPLLITIHPTEKTVRYHILASNEKIHRVEGFREAAKRGLADYLAIPALLHIDPENVEYVLGDDRVLDILSRKGIEKFLERVKEVDKPHRVLKALAKLDNPDYLLSRWQDLPSILFHPDILKEMKDLNGRDLVRLLEEVGRIKEHMEGIDASTALKVIQVLREQPDLSSFLFHRNLLKNIDILNNLSRKRREMLYVLMDIKEYIQAHDEKSLRRLLEVIRSTGNTHIVRLLARHPDLKEYYGVLARGLKGLEEKRIESILDKKDRWKGLGAYEVEEALKHGDVGLRILLSDVDLTAKRDMIRRIDSMTVEDVVAEEISQRHGVPPDRVKMIRKYLGDRTEDFIRHHGYVITSLDRRSLMGLVLFYKQGNKAPDPAEMTALIKMLKTSRLQPDRVVEAVQRMDSGLIKKVALLDEQALRSFFSHILSRPEDLVEEIKRFIETREMTSSRIKTRDKVDIRKEIQDLLSTVDYYDPKRKIVILKKGIRKMGLREREVDVRRFKAALINYLSNRFSLNPRKVRGILDIEKELESMGKGVEVDISVHPIAELKDTDVIRLGSILSSLKRAIDNGHVSVDISKDKKYVNFRLKEKSHEAVVLLDRNFHGYVRNIGGDLRKGKKVVGIPVSFFKALSSHPNMSEHPLVKGINELIMKSSSSLQPRGRKHRRRR